MPIEEWIEEFMFRGRPPTGPGSDQEPFFQVFIGRQKPNAFDPNEPPDRQFVGPKSPEDAEAMGWPLSRLIEGINTTAIAQANEQAAKVRELANQLEKANQLISDQAETINGLKR